MIRHGDCLDVMAGMEPESVDAIVTDPPYGLEFMGKGWDGADGFRRSLNAADVGRDNVFGRTSATSPEYRTSPMRRRPEVDAVNTGVAKQGGRQRQGTDYQRRQARDGRTYQEWCEAWASAAYRIAKPSAYLLSFGGTRTVHRMTVALEDAGWIIRDMLVWGYASGFPKSKASLKPAWEPIVMARKPGPLRMLNIDECRIGTTVETWPASRSYAPGQIVPGGVGETQATGPAPAGRWPANIVLSDPILEVGVPGVVLAGSLTGTMTAWSSSPDSEPNPTVSPARRADRKSSRSVPGVSFPASATVPAGTQLDAWGTSTDTSKPDTGCSDGTTADAVSTSGNTARSGRTPTDRSLGDTSSTIATETGSTTTSPISNSSPELNTPSSTSPRTPRSSDSDETRRPEASDPSSDASENWKPNSPPVPADAEGYSRYFLIPKAARSDREPVLGGQLPTRLKAGYAGGEGDGELTGLNERLRTKTERANVHPTVKPTDLMRHLVRLVTPTGGVVLDPFLGSGTTALAAELEGFDWIGIEREAEYVAIAEARLNGTQRGLGLGA